MSWWSEALTYPEPLGPPRPVAGYLYFSIYVKYSLCEICNLFMHLMEVDYAWLWGTKPGQRGLWVSGLVLNIVSMTDKYICSTTGTAYQNFRRGCCFMSDSPYRRPNYVQRKALGSVSGRATSMTCELIAKRPPILWRVFIRGVQITVRWCGERYIVLPSVNTIHDVHRY